MADILKTITLEQQKTILQSIKTYIDNNKSDFDLDTELAEGGKIKDFIDKALETVVKTEDLQEIEVDTEIKAESENPVQNKAIKTYVDTTLEDYVKKEDVIVGITVQVVTQLPESDISLTTIYLIKQQDKDVYQQWMYIADKWAMLGTTEIDLSGYATDEELAAAVKISAKEGNALTKLETEGEEGLYVSIPDEVAISTADGNLLIQDDNGLHVPSATEAEIKELTDIFTTTI